MNSGAIKLAIISTHPIQYYAPVFKLLTQYIQLKVFYTAGETVNYDVGFQQTILWDIPMLQGYNYTFLNNKSKRPGTHHFMGIDNPDGIKQLKDFDPSHLLIYGWANYGHLKILCYFKGKIPILFRGDSTMLDQRSLLKDLCRSIAIKWVYTHIDKALYTGSNNKVYFKTFGIKEEQLIFVPHTIDNERFSQDNKIALRKNLHLQDSAILILFAGKFVPVKNPQLLLHAFLELNPPNTHLLFVGNGTLESSLKRGSRQNKKIHFLPFQNQSIMPSIYHACDLFCLPSLSESWGLSVNEAMASGKAILASDKVGAAADLIQQKNGRIFNSDDLRSLKEKLGELITNRPELHAKGQASLEIIATWNFDIQVKNILNAFNS